jgi:hypothetical protein
LSEAALAGRIKFTGELNGVTAPIPVGFFLGSRRFSWTDGDLDEWRRVLVHRADFAKWLVETYPTVAALICEENPRAKSIAKSESEAELIVAKALQADPNMTCMNAHALVPNISKTGFKSRIWPQARRRAGLSPVAPAGRKRKSAGGIGEAKSVD